MKKWLSLAILLRLMMLTCNPALAREFVGNIDVQQIYIADATGVHQDPSMINGWERLVSLVRSDREPRSWKTLKLVPGKATSFYYTYLKTDGSVVTTVKDHKIPGIPDERPLRQSHPDLWIVLGAVSALSGPVTAAVVSARGL